MATVAQIAGEVAREWAAEGRIAVPPAVDTPEDDLAFWDEVERRAEAEVEEAFNPHQPRYPRGHAKAGQWRPKLSTGAGRVAPGHLGRDLDALKGLVAEVTGFYEGRSVLPHELNGIGLEVEKVALRYSARKHYEKRLVDLRAERTAIQDRKWSAWEAFFHHPDTTPEMIEKAEVEDFLTPAEAKRIRETQDEEVNLLRERDRADRDAMLGVLEQIRPMGGKLREAKTNRYTLHGGDKQPPIIEDYATALGRERDFDAIKGDLDESLKEVLKVVPKAWLDDTNSKGEVRWEFSRDRAFAGTTVTTPERPTDSFREMEDAVDEALAGKLGSDHTWRSASDVMEAEGDPFPSDGDDAAQAAWRERRDHVQARLATQKYTWVGRAGSPGNPNYPKGLWAVLEGEDKRRYYVNWGGDLSLIREPKETDSPVEKMNLSMPVQKGKREDRRLKGVVPITRQQQETIEGTLREGGEWAGMYDNRYPVVRRAGTEEGGVGPYAAIYDWIDDKGAAQNIHVEDVAPPRARGGREFVAAKWDRSAPRPPVLPVTYDTLIRIDPRNRATLLHELSHRLEQVYGEQNRAGYHPIAHATRSWLDSRTVGEAAKKLQDLYPGYAYEDGEIAKADKFVDGYVGKQYGGEVTEVLTMGMDMLWFPRYGERDINKDPEHRRLILGLLAAL